MDVSTESKDDQPYEESVSSETDDAYEREQLEIALYSQIHFDENPETDLPGDDDVFILEVQGNEQTGYKTNDKTADELLNQDLHEKYGSLPHRDDDIYKQKSRTSHSREKVEDLTDVSKDNQNKPVIILETRSSPVKHKAKSMERKKEASLAEQLILGEGSDNEFTDASDSDSDSCSDSDGSLIYNVLGKYKQDELDLKMNVDVTKQPNNNGDKEWSVSNEDQGLASTRDKGRYYKPIICYNCNQAGHLSKNCIKPKKSKVCIFCSEEGHTNWNCPNMFCYNCGEPGHDGKQCTAPRRNLYMVCFRCNMYGHEQSRCPDIWRQYHLTTSPGKLVKQKDGESQKKHRVFCYNCGDRGHYGHECDEPRMSKFLCVHTPFVCRYQPVKEFTDIEKQGVDSGVEERPIKRRKSITSEFDGKIHNNLHDTEWSKSRSRSEPNNRLNHERGRETRDRGNDKGNSKVKNNRENSTGRNNFDLLQFVIKNDKTGKKKKKKGNLSKGNLSESTNNLSSPDKRNLSADGGRSMSSERKAKSREVSSDRKKFNSNESNGDIRTSNLEGERVGRKSTASATMDRKSVDDWVDFPRGDGDINDITVTFSQNNQKRSSSVRHQNQPMNELSGELFSLNNLNYSKDFPEHEIVEIEDVEHQAYNNEWWNKKKKKKRGKKAGKNNDGADRNVVVEVIS